MTDVEETIIPIARARRVFKNHEQLVGEIAIYPNGGRMVTASVDKTLCLWDLKDGVVLEKMEGHKNKVWGMRVSGDGKVMVSGDAEGRLIVWDDAGKFTKSIKAHSQRISSLDFSPDSAVLATVSWDKTIKRWRTDTWEIHGDPIRIGEKIHRVRYSPSGEFLAITTPTRVQILNSTGLECIATLTANCQSFSWTPDGTRLLSVGWWPDSAIREWDTSTWKQVGDSWSGHTGTIWALALNSTGTLLAASDDKHVRLWRISDRQMVAVFSHIHAVNSVTFSVDDKYILCGDDDNITEWGVPEDERDTEMSNETLPDIPDEREMNDTSDHHHGILTINTIIRNACLMGNLSGAQELLTQQINLDRNNHKAYADISFVLSRKCDWDNALHGALQSLNIQPTLSGYISKGIALCGKMEFSEATKAFDLAFMFAAQDSDIIRLILLVKAVAFFNANKQEEAMQRIKELAAICLDAGAFACQVVEAYLRIQLGINALNDARHDEAVEQFTVVINSGVLSDKRLVYSEYETFVIHFGWDLASSRQTAHLNLCNAFLQAGKVVEAHEAYISMMDMCDEATKVIFLEWSITFKKECSAGYVASADDALVACEYDRAIELYSAAIDLGAMTDTLFANRCKAKLGKMLWEEALVDAQKVTELKPQSYVGFQLKHIVLHGAQQYGEAIEAFEVMLSKLVDIHDPEIQALRQQCISPSSARAAIQTAIGAQMENTPPRLLDTSTGCLCDREAQISAFNKSTEYNQLLLCIIKIQDVDIRNQRIHDVVTVFFSCVMLSHRWDGKEPSLHEIRDKSIYKLNSVEGIMKLQSFCKIARDSGYRWAWIDTCCIDQKDNVEVQRSVNSMFTWYRHSALTIIYLSDVAPSSQSGIIAKSIWITRGWTVQELLAPKIVLFYQSDWSLYLNDRTPNHKESNRIMRELEDATGINGRALTDFHPGMRNSREKLQWASMRATTLPEDIAYSLFGIFGVHLAVIYGEKKHNALGRLLQEIVAQSGDISCLDWVGRASEFNSCLPANIASYATPPFALPSLSEEKMHMSVSLLRDAGVEELASQLFTILDSQSAPRFAQRRLHLPCIIFAVAQVTLVPRQDEQTHFTYAIEANGLCELSITTKDKLIPFSRGMPNQQKLLLVRPWDRNLLGLYDFPRSDLVDYVPSMTTDFSRILPNFLFRNRVPVDPVSSLRGLQLLVGLRQPFRAFLLAAAQQWGTEYNRIAADHDIIAEVQDITSVRDLMGIRTLEIL